VDMRGGRGGGSQRWGGRQREPEERREGRGGSLRSGMFSWRRGQASRLNAVPGACAHRTNGVRGPAAANRVSGVRSLPRIPNRLAWGCWRVSSRRPHNIHAGLSSSCVLFGTNSRQTAGKDRSRSTWRPTTRSRATPATPGQSARTLAPTPWAGAHPLRCSWVVPDSKVDGVPTMRSPLFDPARSI